MPTAPLMCSFHSLRVYAGAAAMLLALAAPARPQSTTDDASAAGSISGVITDDLGTGVAGARVAWSHDPSQARVDVRAGTDGQFAISRVPPGPYHLVITSPGFAARMLAGVLGVGGIARLPAIRLTLAVTVASVNVTPTEVIAAREIKEAEQQRLLGVMPNYFVVYAADAAPLTTGQKAELSRKSLLDPVDFIFTGIIAGVQHLRSDYPGFGGGVSGYGKRYLAFYASILTRGTIDQVLLPSLFRQDPRYFYKGTGSTASRIGYAVATAVIRKGDNRHWQPNYSGILGSLATGLVTNFYYPEADRKGVRLTVENTAIGLATVAASHLAQEFLLRKLTSRPASPKGSAATGSAP